MPSVEFEPAIPANERPQNHALNRGAVGIGRNLKKKKKKSYKKRKNLKMLVYTM
jgi:hypothetical protein